MIIVIRVFQEFWVLGFWVEGLQEARERRARKAFKKRPELPDEPTLKAAFPGFLLGFLGATLP